MTDWLNDLLRDKQSAIDKIRADEQAEREREQRKRNADLQADLEIHRKVANVFRESEVEPLILELVRKVIAGHPQFPNAVLERTIRNTNGGCVLEYTGLMYPSPSAFEIKSGIKQVSPPLGNLEFAQLKFIAEINWTLTLSQRRSLRKYIEISITADGLRINHKKVNPLNVTTIQQTLLRSMRDPITERYEIRGDDNP